MIHGCLQNIGYIIIEMFILMMKRKKKFSNQSDLFLEKIHELFCAKLLLGILIACLFILSLILKINIPFPSQNTMS